MKQFTIHFDPETGGLRQATATVPFSRTIRKAEAVMKGFEVKFTRDDRELHHLHIDIDVEAVAGNTVVVKADFGLRDKSGVFDDEYKGFIQGVVFAQTS